MSVSEEDWDYFIDLDSEEACSFVDFVRRFKCIEEIISTYLNFDQIKVGEDGIAARRNFEEEFTLFTEKNKQLQEDIDLKVAEIRGQERKYEEYRKDEKAFIDETKATHEAFLMGKKFYKDYLKMYYTIEHENPVKQYIFVQFFTENKKESDDYSIKLEYNKEENCYNLLAIKPQLPKLEEMRSILQNTNDMPGFLAYVRQEFKYMKCQNHR